jgi:hypothetical protein
MKKLVLLPAILLIASTAFAQIMLMPATAEIDGDPSNINEVHIEFHNMGENQAMTWLRTVNDIPVGWKTSVCDFNLCWADFADEPDYFFDAPADTIGTVYVKFDARNYHDGGFDPVPGCGTVEVNFFSVLDSANYNALAVFHARLGVEECETNVVSPIYDNNFLIYPNPTKNVINAVASFSANITYAEIVNATGSVVKTYSWNTASGKMTFELNDLPPGMYFVRLVDADNKGVYTEKVMVE